MYSIWAVSYVTSHVFPWDLHVWGTLIYPRTSPGYASQAARFEAWRPIGASPFLLQAGDSWDTSLRSKKIPVEHKKGS